jgi:hypothetical protein
VDPKIQELLNALDAAGKSTASFRNEYERLKKEGQEVNSLMNTMESTLKGAQAEARGLGDGFRDVRDILRESLAELKETETAIKQGTKAYRNLTSVVTSLAQEEEGIYTYSVKQLETYDKRAKSALSEQKLAAERLAREKIGLNFSGELNEQTIDRLKFLGKINDEEEALLRAAANGFDIEEESVRLIEKRLKREKALVKTFGLAGAALEGATKIANKFGMSHISEELNDINSQLKDEMRAEIKANGDESLGFGRKFAYAGRAIGKTAVAIGKGMMDPLFIIGKIFNSFLNINKEAVNLSRLVGRSNVSFNNLNSSLATTVELLQEAAEFTRQTGLAATSIFSNDQLANIAESKKLLGLSAEQAGNLALFSNQTGDSITQFEDGLVDGIKAANKLGKSAVAPGVALQDALSAAKGIALSLGNNPKLLGQAATAARALGLELSRVDDIAEGLLDFESSIQNELEAQLLTGGRINLAKARELALNNDLAGLSAELAKNGASAAEFANMNRIAQTSLAKALGMSRDELANMLILQDTQGNLTDEQRQKILGVTKEQLKSLDIQQSINDSITKMSEALAGPLASLAQLISHATILKGIIGGIATIIGINMVTGLIQNLKYLGRVLKLSKGIAIAEAAIASVRALSNPFLAIAGIAAAAAVAGAAGYYIGKAKQTGDLQINPNGGPVVMSPREGGLYQGTKNDALMMAPPGAMGGSNAELIAEIRALRTVVEKGGDVVMDGSKVGQVITMNSYKLS